MLELEQELHKERWGGMYYYCMQHHEEDGHTRRGGQAGRQAGLLGEDRPATCSEQDVRAEAHPSPVLLVVVGIAATPHSSIRISRFSREEEELSKRKVLEDELKRYKVRGGPRHHKKKTTTGRYDDPPVRTSCAMMIAAVPLPSRSCLLQE